MTSVLLLESARANGSSFALHLSKRYELLVAHTGKAAKALTQRQSPDVLVLDAASMRTSGDRICASLRNDHEDLPIIHIKQEIDQRLQDSKEQQEGPADVLLYMPFTYRKLYNRIERFTCGRHGDMLTASPFKLNLQQNLLITPHGEEKLTPKLSKLMQMFMQNPNEIVERRQLMNHVWQTDYMGDTRTLDVHIRWIREAVEKNPSKPKFIRTVRGKGYILELPA